jgi:predicted outer membrane repeat protein
MIRLYFISFSNVLVFILLAPVLCDAQHNNNTIRITNDIFLNTLPTFPVQSCQLYVSSTTGSITNNGTTKDSPFLALRQVFDRIYNSTNSSDSAWNICLGEGELFTGESNIHLTISSSLSFFGGNQTTISGNGTAESLFIIKQGSVIFQSIIFTEAGNSSIFITGPTSVSFYDCEFTMNNPTTSTTDGGAIYIGDPSANVLVQNSSFHSNYGQRGGGIFLLAGHLTVLGGHFVNNQAVAGGAISYWHLPTEEYFLIINGTHFLQNRAKDGGGAIFGQAYVTNAHFIENLAEEAGGAISLLSSYVENCHFHNNTASLTGFGGAIYNYVGQSTLTNVEIHNSTAGIGGSIYLALGSLKVINGNFTNNYASIQGGAVAVVSSVESDSVTFYNCHFVLNRSGGTGGAVMIDVGNGNFSFHNCLFESNHAEMEGGAISSLEGQFRMDNCSFINNNAQRSGGAIYASAYNGPIIATGSDFIGNQGWGGGAFWCGSGDVILESCTFTNNRARQLFGGGIFIGNANVTMIGCPMTNNTAAFGGGAIMMNGGNATLSGCVLTSNAGDVAGQIYLYQLEAILPITLKVTNGSSISGSFSVNTSFVAIGANVSFVLIESSLKDLLFNSQNSSLFMINSTITNTFGKLLYSQMYISHLDITVASLSIDYSNLTIVGSSALFTFVKFTNSTGYIYNSVGVPLVFQCFDNSAALVGNIPSALLTGCTYTQVPQLIREAGSIPFYLIPNTSLAFTVTPPDYTTFLQINFVPIRPALPISIIYNGTVSPRNLTFDCSNLTMTDFSTDFEIISDQLPLNGWMQVLMNGPSFSEENSTVHGNRVVFYSSNIYVDVELLDQWKNPVTVQPDTTVSLCECSTGDEDDCSGPQSTTVSLPGLNQTYFPTNITNVGRKPWVCTKILLGSTFKYHVYVLSWTWFSGFLFVLFLGAVIGSIFYRARRYKNKLQKQLSLILKQDEEIQQLQSVWKINPDHLVFKKHLSKGATGEVWLSEWRENVVAVKKLLSHLADWDPKSIEEFEEEAAFLQTIRHPNVVLFFGAGRLEDGTPFIVIEYVPHGSLYSLLKDEGTSLSTRMKIGFCIGAAKGMSFLHSRNPPIIHRDLKPHNLLVTNQYQVKITDFGTARLVGSQQQRSQTSLEDMREILTGRHAYHNPRPLQGTVRVGSLLYMAPEVMKRNSNYGKAIDVYSFGVTMWAVAMGTGEEPYTEMDSMEILRHVSSGGRPEVSSSWSRRWSYLMQQCWNPNPNQRPTFETALEVLLSIANTTLEE